MASNGSGTKNRTLDFDISEEVEVKLGGRTFIITEQKRAIIEKVLRASQESIDSPSAENDKEVSFEETLFKNWESSIPMFASILGYDTTGPDRDEVIDHLDEHLSIRAAVSILQEWWVLNAVDDFLDRGGRMLTPQNIVNAIRDVRDREMKNFVAEQMKESQTVQ